MSNWLSLPVLALAAILQSTFVPQIRILGGGPDLVFLFVLAWALNARIENGVTWAFVGGILQDVLSAAPTGASALGMIVTVFIINQINRQVYGVSLAVIAALVLVGTLIQQVLLMLVLRLTGFAINPLDSFSYVVVPTMAYNFVLIWPIYWIVRRLQKRYTRDGRLLV
jgi:rod shape-determining protein MreD